MSHYPKFFLDKGFVGHVYKLKNSLKFKLLSFWRKKTPIIDQKCTYEKVTKNLGRALPLLIWTKSKRTAAFFRDVFPKISTFSEIVAPTCWRLYAYIVSGNVKIMHPPILPIKNISG